MFLLATYIRRFIKGKMSVIKWMTTLNINPYKYYGGIPTLKSVDLFMKRDYYLENVYYAERQISYI